MRTNTLTAIFVCVCLLFASPADAQRKFKKFSYSKAAFLKNQAKRARQPIIGKKPAVRAAAAELSNLRPSRTYRTNGAIDARVCGGDGIFNSYEEYLTCADLAVVQCTGDEFEKAFCIYERCGNTPDNFEGLWRDLGSQSRGGGNSYYKSNFGSESIGNDSIAISLHPCLLDGAIRFTSNSSTSASAMGALFSLGGSDLKLFHPGKSNNKNLSSGRVRLNFDGDILITINRDDFGATTVPFAFQKELFKSFRKTPEDASRVYWVDKVIPVNMVFRPQGVIGIELEARVSPEARVLEVDFATYNDFGTSADAGAAREGVGKNTSMGVISLVQSEYRTNKFVSMNADDSGMLPSITEYTQLEFWPAKGAFKPICAQWFASKTTHPEYGYRCSTLVDLGPLRERKGSVKVIRDGTDRILVYDDPEDEQEVNGLVPFPYRNPILDDF